MEMYLARAEDSNGYINIRPLLCVNEGGFSKVDEELFGRHGTLALQYFEKYRGNPFFQNQSYFVFELEENKLFYDANEKCKIDASDLLKKAKSIDILTVKELISLSNGYDLFDFKNWRTDVIQGIMRPVTLTVYLKSNDKIAGPFRWEEVSGNCYRFIPKNQNHMLQCYENLDSSCCMQEPRYSDFYPEQYRSFLKVDSLPDVFESIDGVDNESLKALIGQLLSKNEESRKEIKRVREIVNSLPEIEISPERRIRILELMKNAEFEDELIAMIPAMALEDNALSEKLTQKLFENKNYHERLYSIIRKNSGYDKLFDQIKNEKTQKEQELEDLKNQISELTSSVNSTNCIAAAEIEKLLQEKQLLQEKMKSYEEFENINLACKEKQEEYKVLTEKADQAKAMYDTFNNSLTKTRESFTNDISKKIQDAYSSLAFDGAIASLMLKEASQFERKEKINKLENNLLTIECVKKSSLLSEIQTSKELINFIHDKLTNDFHRKISKNEIANLLLCISQGFLTVFAGEPGVGKTSLVSLLARVLGLTNQLFPRYTEIAVEKGWTSRRDLVGYYNPLNKSFEVSNKGLFSGLSVLDAEAKKEMIDFPYLVLLDEANLSSMEHYWADFMSLCDFDKEKRILSLSDDCIFCVPETLRFLATINLDHTTEMLSPRLIDRAWMILLDAPDIDIEECDCFVSSSEYKLVSYSVLKELFNPSVVDKKNLDSEIVSKFQRIQNCFKGVGVYFSPRIISLIKKYCIGAEIIMDLTENAYTALDYAVAQKVLPMINGYGEKYESFVNDLIRECDPNSMPKTNKLLISIRQKGSQNMKYFQFFAR